MARSTQPGARRRGWSAFVTSVVGAVAAAVLVAPPAQAADDGADLSGRLVVAEGAPWDATPWTVAAVPVAGGAEVSTSATAGGSFRLVDVPAGDYRIRATPAQEHSGAPAMWLGDTLDEDRATVVTAAPGAVLDSLDVTLLAADTIERRASGNGTPYVKGTPKVGWTLTAEPQDWTVEDDWLGQPMPVTPDMFTYQWLADGQPVAGATAKTFAPTAAELGATLAVRIGIDLPNTTLLTPSVSRDYGPVVPGDNVTCSRVTLSGKAKVGRTLTARRSGCWTAPGTTVVHVWYVDGREVATTDTPRLRLRKAYRGDRVSVEAVAQAPGYADASVRTASRKVR